MMNPLPFFPILLISLNLGTMASPINTGQSTAEVIDALGEPVGMIELREKTLLLYPQGEVTLKQDRVTEIDLMDEVAFRADQQRLRQEREEWLADQEHREAARIAEGEALRAEKLQSSAFAALPAKDRVDFWRRFQARYPEVEVTSHIASAIASYQHELEELRTQQRIADLEARIAQAEKEAATARLETEKLREATERAEQRRNYGLRYTSDRIIRDDRYVYRPPTITIFTSGDGKNKTHHTNKTYRYGENSARTESVAERATRILNAVNP